MDANKLFDSTVTQLERMLNTKTVVGEPLKVDGATLIPLVSLGVGFGVGGGEGVPPGGSAPGQGAATAGGGGVKPVAVLVCDAQGVRVESITGPASVIGKIAESVTELARTKLGAAEAKKLGA